jgi:predicted lysophospholipase L1 biosynthesis ABC-type transport system permease subunit
MLTKIIKITFKKSEKYFAFVFLAVFLSLFSYILWNNIVLSVKDYLKSQIKPIVWGDLVLSWKDDLKDLNYFKKYEKDFEIAKNINISSTIFDKNKNPTLVSLVYRTSNFPFYNQFEYKTISSSWSLIVNQAIYDKFGDNIEILWQNYRVSAIISKSPLSGISMNNVQNTIYLPISDFDTKLNSTNSRLEYKYFLKFRWAENKTILQNIKDDKTLSEFRKTTLDDRNENISNITDRFYVFINFFNLVVFVLTFFIIILSLETFFKKIKNTIGLLNIFWLKKSKIFFYNFVILWALFVVSFLLAYLLNIVVIKYFSLKYDFFSVKTEVFYRWLLISFVLLIVWVFSPFYKILKSDIWSMLKDDSNFSNFSYFDYFLYLLLIFSWFLAINLISGIGAFDSLLYSFIFVFVIALFYVIIEYGLKLLFRLIYGKVKSKVDRFSPSQEWQKENDRFSPLQEWQGKDFYTFDAIRSTIKPGNVSFLIIFSSIISFLSIFVFYVFSGSFLSYLQNITQDSKDTFVINAQWKDLKTIKKYLNDDEIYEIVTLRIKKINGQTLEQYLKTPKVWREFGREFFSTTKNLDNKILSWDKLQLWWVSVDSEFANSLWLKLWDEIVFSVAWLEKTLKVQNFREAVRNGSNPFFYFMLDSRDFEKYPKNYILSYKSSIKPKDLDNTLSKEVWNYLTFIKTKEIIDIVIGIAKQILLVVYFCLFYIFIFSFISFVVSVWFLFTFKTKKVVLLNILWGDLFRLKKAVNLEFLYLIFIWFMVSFVFGSIFLGVIFYFVKYFTLSLISYAIWFTIILVLFLIMSVYLIIRNRKLI